MESEANYLEVTDKPQTALKTERGVALLVVIMVMVILLAATGAGVLFSGLDHKSATNLKTGNMALQIADAGIQHGLAIIPNGLEFDNLLTGSVSGFTCAGTCNGASIKPTLSGSLSGYSYSVVAENDTSLLGETATDDENRIVTLTSTATGPDNSVRKVKAYVGRSSSAWAPPGTIYIPGQAAYIETKFTGTSFQISGNDTNVGGAAGSGSASAIPGITTSDSATKTEISGASGSLASNQYAEVTGEGTSPSVATQSTLLDVEQLALDLDALGVEGIDKQTLSSGTYTNEEWGTSTVPKITRITGNATLQGSTTGYGVLIVDGNFSTKQSFTWKGLVIVRGNADIHGTSSTDGATIWGAVLIKESTSSDTGEEVAIAGPTKIYYSSETLNVVNSRWGSAFPKAPRLIAWQEILDSN